MANILAHFFMGPPGKGPLVHRQHITNKPGIGEEVFVQKCSETERLLEGHVTAIKNAYVLDKEHIHIYVVPEYVHSEHGKKVEQHEQINLAS